jgi:hypothetical protein
VSVYVTYDAVLYDKTDSHKKAEMSERGGRGGRVLLVVKMPQRWEPSNGVS